MSPISMAHSSGMYELWADDYVCKYSGKVEDYEGHLIETPVKRGLYFRATNNRSLKAIYKAT